MIIKTYDEVFKGSAIQRGRKPSYGRPSKYHFGIVDEDGVVTTACGLKFDTITSRRPVEGVSVFDMCSKCMVGVVVVNPEEGRVAYVIEANEEFMVNEEEAFEPTDAELNDLQMTMTDKALDDEHASNLAYEFAGKEEV